MKHVAVVLAMGLVATTSATAEDAWAGYNRGIRWDPSLDAAIEAATGPILAAAMRERLGWDNVSVGDEEVRSYYDEHPEIFDLDRLLKQMQQVTRSYRRKKKMRDVVEFLCETEKSLQIILKNHLQDAMRMYFK